MLCNNKKENLQKNFCIRGSIYYYNSNTDLLLILFVFSPCDIRKDWIFAIGSSGVEFPSMYFSEDGRNNGKKTIYLLDVKSEVLAIVILV